MNDERFLQDWLKDTAPEAGGARSSADRVMQQLPDTKQRSRWWPLVPISRRSPPPGSAHHERETRLMISPAKLIAASALLAMAGVLLLVAGPAGPDALPAASESASSGMATTFEGKLRYSSPNVQGTVETLPNGVVANRGRSTGLATVETSDPRLDGTGTNAWNSDTYRRDGVSVIWQGGLRIENEDGAWQMRPAVQLSLPDGEYSVFTAVFDGEGGYQGLIAIAEVAEGGLGFDLRGVITDGELPPTPELMR